MAKLDPLYEPHLAIVAVEVPPGAEWNPAFRGWAVISLHSGTAYWLHPFGNMELGPGSVLILAEGEQGVIRASQISAANLRYFRVEPERLTGLVTLREKEFFAEAATRKDLAAQVFDPKSGVAQKFSAIDSCEANTMRVRLELLALFFQAFGEQPSEQLSPSKMQPSASQRLRDFLALAPLDGLLDLQFSDLAGKLHCTPRHLGRVFQETLGMSFREKQTEVRLARACELLATTEAKILDVALESGYQSVSLFNSMFKRRHGITPARWRQKSRGKKSVVPRSRSQSPRFVPAAL